MPALRKQLRMSTFSCLDQRNIRSLPSDFVKNDVFLGVQTPKSRGVALAIMGAIVGASKCVA
jgi:hypothetical protein